MVPSAKEYIVFACPEVERIAIANYSSDGVGVTLADAAAVTNIGTKFYNNSQITSFDELQYFTGLTTIPNAAFYNDTNLVSVVLPPTVTVLDQRAFYLCSRLTSVGSMANVTSIGYQCFSNCSSLSINLSLPSLTTFPGNGGEFTSSGITGIADLGSLGAMKAQSFSACASLTSVDIPDTITSMPQWCFLNCTSLTTATIRATTPPTADRAFQGCSALTAIYVPAASVAAYKAANYWSTLASIIQAIP